MPITLLDILLIPIALVFGYVLIKDLFFGDQRNVPKEVSLISVIGYMIFTVIVLFPLGFYCIVLGVNEPMAVLTGVKGHVHGYTAVIIGLFVVGLSMGLVYRLANKIRAMI